MNLIFVISAVIHARLSSPHIDTRVSLGVNLTFHNLVVNLTTFNLQDVLALYLHTKEWRSFVYQKSVTYYRLM